MSSSNISTNDDLVNLADELERIRMVHTLKVAVAVNDFALKRLLQGFFQAKKFRQYAVYDKGAALLQTVMASKDKFIVFYDLEMPDKNGLELIAALRKHSNPHKNVIIVLVVGQISVGAKEKLVTAGVNHVLSRPVSQDALEQFVKDLKFPG